MNFEDLMLPFGMNDLMYCRALEAVAEDKATFRFSKRTNTFRGIAAHLLISRHGLGALTDMGFEPLPWNDLGKTFDAGFLESDNFPQLSEILSEWQKITPAFMAKLPELSEEVLDRQPPFPLPNMPDARLREFVRLMVLHESYHVGQLGFMIKELTGEAIMTPPTDTTD